MTFSSFPLGTSLLVDLAAPPEASPAHNATPSFWAVDSAANDAGEIGPPAGPLLVLAVARLAWIITTATGERQSAISQPRARGLRPIAGRHATVTVDGDVPMPWYFASRPSPAMPFVWHACL